MRHDCKLLFPVEHLSMHPKLSNAVFVQCVVDVDVQKFWNKKLMNHIHVYIMFLGRAP